MSNGDPPPVSSSAYIIICSGRTEVNLAKDADTIIMAAVRTAAQTCAFLEIKKKATATDMADITRLQHWLMEHGAELSKQEAKDKAAEMFSLLTILEHLYPPHDY